jgi:hypothetical protein
LKVLNLQMSDMARQVENAIQFGNPVLLQVTYCVLAGTSQCRGIGSTKHFQERLAPSIRRGFTNVMGGQAAAPTRVTTWQHHALLTSLTPTPIPDQDVL